jgi:hypothetical protein
MAVLITIAFVVALVGVVLGAYIKVCLAIRREDRRKWSLRSEARNQAARSARALVNLSGSRWD